MLRVCDGSVLPDSSPDTRKRVNAFLNTHSRFLSEEGKGLKAKLVAINNFNKELTCRKKSSKSSKDFIENKFRPFYEKHGDQMRDLVLWHLFEHMMEVLNGNSRAKIGQKAMIF